MPSVKRPAHASDGAKSVEPCPSASGRPLQPVDARPPQVASSGPMSVVNRTHSSSSPQNSFCWPAEQTVEASSAMLSPLQSVSMIPSPFTSEEVSIFPSWLRSMHSLGSLAI
jgi:hypothetical protein